MCHKMYDFEMFNFFDERFLNVSVNGNSETIRNQYMISTIFKDITTNEWKTVSDIYQYESLMKSDLYEIVKQYFAVGDRIIPSEYSEMWYKSLWYKYCVDNPSKVKEFRNNYLGFYNNERKNKNIFPVFPILLKIYKNELHLLKNEIQPFLDLFPSKESVDKEKLIKDTLENQKIQLEKYRIMETTCCSDHETQEDGIKSISKNIMILTSIIENNDYSCAENIAFCINKTWRHMFCSSERELKIMNDTIKYISQNYGLGPSY